MNNLKYIALIPARYASTRFPGKPLAKLGGMTVIERVVRQVRRAGIPCAVATDDRRISDTLEALGIKAVMTSADHRSGTDRIEEAARILQTDADVIINVQGDEPFILPDQIKSLTDCFDDPSTCIATLARSFNPALGFDALADPNLVKVTFDACGNALYFSRSVIPYLRGKDPQEWPSLLTFHTHIGMYAYRRETLSQLTALPQSGLEKAESLEQLRWLEAGYRIHVAVSDHDTIGIDTPADLEAAAEFLDAHKDLYE